MAMYREPSIVPGLMGTGRLVGATPAPQTGGVDPPYRAPETIIANTGGPLPPNARQIRTGGPLPPTQAFIRTGGPDPAMRLPQVATGGPLPPTEVVNRVGGMLPIENRHGGTAGNSGIVPPGFNRAPGLTRPAGMVTSPTMPQGQAMQQRPVSNNGVAPQASAPTGRPAMMGTLFHNRIG